MDKERRKKLKEERNLKELVLMFKDKFKSIRHPNFKSTVKGGISVLIASVIIAAIISLFDLGMQLVVSLLGLGN